LNERKKTKTISIRGLDNEIYRQLTIAAKEMGKTIGEVTNEAIKLYLTLIKGSESIARKLSTTIGTITKAFKEGLKETEIDIVRGLDELTISRKDLVSYGKPIAFMFIGKLKFDEDVDTNIFMKYVDSIISCNEVCIPKTLSKIIVGRRCRFVKKITVY